MLLRRIALATVLVACAAAGAWTTVRVGGPQDHPSSLGDVRLQVEATTPGRRGLEVYVPLTDWGLRAPVTGAPVRVSAEPRTVDRQGVVAVVTGDGGRRLRAVRGQLTSAVEAAAVRAAGLAVSGALAGGVLAALLWHVLGVRGRALGLAPAGGLAIGAVLTGGLAVWASATWDARRLERPVYYASGTELRRLLEQAATLRRTGERYADRVDLAVRSIAGLLDERAVPGSAAANRIALASDLHDNLLTLPALRGYAAGRPVVLAGDFSINGSRLELGMLRGLERLGRPVVAVSGNHDSPGLMRDLARRGVVVLTRHGRLQPDGRVTGPAVVALAGLRVAGYDDPLQYRGGTFPDGVRAAMSFGDFADGRRRYELAVQDLWTWWQGLGERPQVLVVHQEALGRALGHLIWARDPGAAPLTVLAGHTHRQRVERLGPVTVVNAGTAGAGGIFGAGRDPVGLALLDFAADGRLEASDLVRMDPSTAAARARRVIARRPDCDGDVVRCPAAPDPPDLPDAGTIDAPTGPRGPASR